MPCSKAEDELMKKTDEGNATFAAFQAKITSIEKVKDAILVMTWLDIGTSTHVLLHHLAGVFVVLVPAGLWMRMGQYLTLYIPFALVYPVLLNAQAGEVHLPIPQRSKDDQLDEGHCMVGGRMRGRAEIFNIRCDEICWSP